MGARWPARERPCADCGQWAEFWCQDDRPRCGQCATGWRSHPATEHPADWPEMAPTPEGVPPSARRHLEADSGRVSGQEPRYRVLARAWQQKHRPTR